MSAKIPESPVPLTFVPVFVDAPEPSSTGVGRHNREATHFGELEASLVALAAALGVHDAGDDLQTVLTALEARVSVLENSHRRFSGFDLDSIVRGVLSGTFSLDTVIASSGPGTVTIRPISDVARSGSGITRSSGSEQWPLVDETPNDNADWVKAGATNVFWTVQCADPGLTGSTITKVVVFWEGTNAASSNTQKLILRDVNNSANYSSTGSIAVGATSFSQEWVTKPWGDGVWADSDVAALVIGVKAGSSPFNCFTGSIWAVVHHE